MPCTKSPVTVLEATALAVNRLVKITGSGNPPTVTYAAAGGDFHAVTQNTPNTSAEAASYAVAAELKNAAGFVELTASGAITALAPIYADANGKVTATPQGPKIGIALKAAAADGDYFDAFLSRDIIAVPIEYNASSVDKASFIANGVYQVLAIKHRVTAAGTDGSAVTADIKKAPSGTAISGGTTLMTGTVDLKGTANTNQTVTLSATAASLLLADGDAIGPDFTGTLTSATGVFTVYLAPA